MLDRPILTKIEPIEISDDEDMVDGDDTVEITNTVQGVPKYIPGEVEFVKQQPSHPRVRAKMKQTQKKIKSEGDDNVEFVKQTPVHSRLRAKIKQNQKKIKNENAEDNVAFIK